MPLETQKRCRKSVAEKLQLSSQKLNDFLFLHSEPNGLMNEYTFKLYCREVLTDIQQVRKELGW